MIVKVTSLYKLQNMKCSGFEWVNNFFQGILGGALAPSAPSCIVRTPLMTKQSSGMTRIF